MFIRFDMIHERDRQMDGHCMKALLYSRHAVFSVRGKNHCHCITCSFIPDGMFTQYALSDSVLSAMTCGLAKEQWATVDGVAYPCRVCTSQ